VHWTLLVKHIKVVSILSIIDLHISYIARHSLWHWTFVAAGGVSLVKYGRHSETETITTITMTNRLDNDSFAIFFII